MNIPFIHLAEMCILCLVVFKIFQIRRLYLQAAARTAAQIKSQKRDVGLPGQAKKNHRPFTFNEPSANLSFNSLPLPEVSFSSNKDKVVSARPIEPSTHKTILNSYIDEFFFEETPKDFFQEVDNLHASSRQKDQNVEDEFITVAEENAELVRAFQLSNQRLVLVR